MKVEPLTGKELLKKVASLTTREVRELAIACGYYFESISAHGQKIIKARKQKFINALEEAGGDSGKLINDRLSAQKKYQRNNREKNNKMVADWRTRNQEKIREYTQREEVKEKVRKAALKSYYQRKAKEAKVDDILGDS